MPVLVNSEKIFILEHPKEYNYSTDIVGDAALWYFLIFDVFSIANVYSFHNSGSSSCVLLSEDNTATIMFRRFPCYLLYMSRGPKVNHLHLYYLIFSPPTTLVLLCRQRSHRNTHFQQKVKTLIKLFKYSNLKDYKNTQHLKGIS